MSLFYLYAAYLTRTNAKARVPGLSEQSSDTKYLRIHAVYMRKRISAMINAKGGIAGQKQPHNGSRAEYLIDSSLTTLHILAFHFRPSYPVLN